MNLHKSSLDGYLFGLAFALALAARLINLGMPALNDAEATWALQALHVAQGSHLWLGSQPAYVQLTGALFTFLGSTDFLARVWPALTGSLLVLVPILLRAQLGRIPALMLAFGLALDPGLLAVSRQAGSPIFALAGGWLALTFWLAGKPRWAGIFLGIGLLGGEGFWPGLISFAIAYWLLRSDFRFIYLKRNLFAAPPEGLPLSEGELPAGGEKPSTPGNPIRTSLLFAVGTLLGVGTLFFLRPMGISGLAGGLTTYLAGWANPSGVSSIRLLVALAAYAPLALILGGWASVRAWIEKNPLDQFLSLWAGIALLLVLVYPARQVDSLVWTLVPLWVLAAREILRHVALPKIELINTLSQGLLTFAVLVFVWLNLQGMVNDQTIGAAFSPRLLPIGFALALLLLASFLIAWGWGASITRRGLVWGLCAVLLIYGLGAATEAGAMRVQYTSELWINGPSLPQANQLVSAINQLSNTRTGVKSNLDLVVVGIQSTGLEWALRQFPKPLFTSALTPGVMPSIVITAKSTQPTLAASYRGDAFDLTLQPNWTLILPTEYLPWFIYHTAPQITQSVILWARADLFPGGTLLPAVNSTP
jgi:hypothetical protein